MNTPPVTVTVTGAAGQIAYAPLFRIAPVSCSEIEHPSGCSCSRSRKP